ncbi:Predicted DNA-binding protein, MmcQ/YjbR family [Lishizhenia tianjinensis]|uniref:Predicted DNA-binding protein, MmcQ/YjbR family n=1 Tax=Lishizhenia tianjinensis TaxID=477690 RepID=A0A1I6ZI61_9FLAO|nr:MmcQ/YjbR family DNA-binding protein [Lishizhenia tianjinensis]SFT62382.1 Predicted DNA-binding protein, MmcQ/YjbR family [Lishizhenia tianjinensis]
MNIEEIRTYCLQKKSVEESFPFDAETLVFKVAGKMFALMALEKGDGVNLKCDPERALELRDRYEGVLPGYHMSKVHWNTVKINSDVPDALFFELIDHSYELVVQKLPKKIQKTLE